MKSLIRFFQKTFITGLIVLIPVWITVLILKALIGWIKQSFDLLPRSLQPSTYIPVFGIEILIALLLITLVGLIAGNYFGSKLLSLAERFLVKIPVIKTVYQGIKHLTAGIMGNRKIFSRVVLVEFPFKGMNSLGFVTGETSESPLSSSGTKRLKIFIPTTPNPTSGFFCLAAEENVRSLDMSVDDAFKIIISAGYADL